MGRRLTEQSMRPTALKKLHPVLEAKARQFIRSALEKPRELPEHLKLYVTSIVRGFMVLLITIPRQYYGFTCSSTLMGLRSKVY